MNQQTVRPLINPSIRPSIHPPFISVSLHPCIPWSKDRSIDLCIWRHDTWCIHVDADLIEWHNNTHVKQTAPLIATLWRPLPIGDSEAEWSRRACGKESCHSCSTGWRVRFGRTPTPPCHWNVSFGICRSVPSPLPQLALVRVFQLSNTASSPHPAYWPSYWDHLMELEYALFLDHSSGSASVSLSTLPLREGWVQVRGKQKGSWRSYI